MKKRTDFPSPGVVGAPPKTSSRLRSAAKALRRASRSSVRDGHEYEANRVAAELAIIADHRSAFDRYGR